MSATVPYTSSSLDGFVAGPNEGPGKGSATAGTVCTSGTGDTVAFPLHVYGADPGNMPGCWTFSRSSLVPSYPATAVYTSMASSLSSSNWSERWRHHTPEIDEDSVIKTPTTKGRP